jgi:transposase
MENRRRFTAEFKQEAVRLLKTSGKSAAVLARELGIPRNRIYKWAADVDAAGTTAFSGSGRPKQSQDTLAVLERENARLREENAILKKAAAYFARELT